jgi:hypothetical protein
MLRQAARRNYEDVLLVGDRVNDLEVVPMLKFVTIGYGNQEGYDRTALSVRDAAHAHDAKLPKDGVLMGLAGAPVQVRNTGAAEVERRKARS